MRKLISILMMVAFVMTTTMPVSSHAMMQPEVAKTAQTEQAIEGHDCHGHGEAKATTDETAQNDKNSPDKCCDKGMCKCVCGTCHNGLSKIFGNSGDALLAFAYSQPRFGSTSESADSAFLEGLKRPPRA